MTEKRAFVPFDLVLDVMAENFEKDPELRAAVGELRRIHEHEPPNETGVIDLTGPVAQVANVGRRMLSQPMVVTGSPIESAQQIELFLDRLDPPDNLACRRGCHLCCHTAPVTSEAEAKLIANKVRAMPRNLRRRVMERLQREVKKFSPLPEMNPQGRICPMLSSGECAVYDVRPLICRGLVSFDVSTCDPATSPGVSVDPLRYWLYAEAQALHSVREPGIEMHGELAVMVLRELDEAFAAGLEYKDDPTWQAMDIAGRNKRGKP